MITQCMVFPQQYRDSVSLMRLSSAYANRPGIARVSVVMATEANLELLRGAGLLDQPVQAGPNDLIVAVGGDSADIVEAVLAEAKAAVLESAAATTGGGRRRDIAPKSLSMALEGGKEADLVLISTPGDWAGHEAAKALRRGMHVMMFSDNVSIEEEAELKAYAAPRNLLVMGPDCGTAIIAGVPLAFANVVRRGRIGVVGGSGTGTQQVTCLVDRLGQGISHAIGTGGHDLSRDIGGATTLQGIRMLGDDPETKVLLLVSKPPAPEVAEKVLRAASATGKPVVVNFIGLKGDLPDLPGLHAARTLEEASIQAVRLAGGEVADVAEQPILSIPAYAPTQKYLRALYSGGTFCYEATMLLADLPGIRSNTPIEPGQKLADPWKSAGHTLVDMGDDVFTRGRPHPMMDPSLRLARIAEEAADPETAIILLDLVLGYGSHPNPAESMAEAVVAARQAARAQGREVVFVGFICGTDKDPQPFAQQERLLREAGVYLASSNARAVRLAEGLLPQT